MCALNEVKGMKLKMKDLLHNMDLTRLKKITQKDLQRTEKYWKSYLKIINQLEGEENDRY